ncbi:MAG TPA: response regulator transcription factor [Iamia sp.]|nr:response regulator transcription factor [Iamia sp.]
MKILVVDDEEALRDLVTTALEFVGHEVATAVDGLDALAQVPGFAPDLIVLDVNMPHLDGLEVCRRLRADGDTTPVIFLTARDAPRDVVEGLAAGGDDHLAKPFHLQVLVARIDAVLRRAGNGAVPGATDGPPRLAFDDIEMDEAAHRVWRAGAPIALAPTEFKLLRYLLLNPDIVLSKGQIAQHIWQYEFGGDPNVVETYISYLRKKLGPPRVIQTVRGVGYVLRADDA